MTDTASARTTLELRLPRLLGAYGSGLERAAIATTALAIAGLPLLVPGGPANSAPVDVMIAISTTVCLVWAWRAHVVWSFPYTIAIAVFVVGGALGALAGPVPRAGALALAQDLVLLVWCWSIANVGAALGRLRIVLAAWAYSATAWAAVLVVGLAIGSPTLAGQTTREGARTTLTLHDPNYAASYFFVSLMVVWAAGVPRRGAARAAACALLIVALVSTGSNSGLVALVVGVGLAGPIELLRRRGTMPAVAALSFVVLTVALFTAAVGLSGVQRWAQDSNHPFLRDGVGRAGSSISQRDTLLQESLRLYRTGGFLGQGPTSTKTRLEAEQAPFVKEAHDDYAAALIERGAIGAIGLLLLVGAVLRRAFVTASARPGRSLASVLPHPGALFGAVAGTLVAAAFNELLHARHVWALFAVVAALAVHGGRCFGDEPS